ncbi:PaaI family thioesterase [Sedimentibacter sp. zth1]|uniref:PaaI family thioesterase n=1 Tax=Sedimentibacter sp. zth1 TaxID=2816908 RepID=UPI001A93975D|nr:PaaI family thioesterase [Sedimentibacter sp. zth1]QSX05583.1 PaaI family thioesterase [Sedimentibacter sp. zth1]
MKNKVLKTQYVSKDCFICGVLNDAGLKVKFYEMETQELVGIFIAKDCHQSYPNRLHGGVSAALLDEVMGRAIMIHEPDTWGVTAELMLKYKKPIPLNEELKVITKITRNTRIIYEAEGYILLNNGEVAATAHGKYMKMPIEKIARDIENKDKLIVYEEDKGPEYIEY